MVVFLGVSSHFNNVLNTWLPEKQNPYELIALVGPLDLVEETFLPLYGYRIPLYRNF